MGLAVAVHRGPRGAHRAVEPDRVAGEPPADDRPERGSRRQRSTPGVRRRAPAVSQPPGERRRRRTESHRTRSPRWRSTAARRRAGAVAPRCSFGAPQRRCRRRCRRCPGRRPRSRDRGGSSARSRHLPATAQDAWAAVGTHRCRPSQRAADGGRRRRHRPVRRRDRGCAVLLLPGSRAERHQVRRRRRRGDDPVAVCHGR